MSMSNQIALIVALIALVTVVSNLPSEAATKWAFIVGSLISTIILARLIIALLTR
jgi:hypothetical protein